MNKTVNLVKSLLTAVLLLIAVGASAQELKTLPYAAMWKTGLDEWQVNDLKYHSKTWKWKAAGVATITDSKRENNDWLISPAIDCKGVKRLKVAFKAGWNKAQSSNVELYYSLNYEGNQEEADWVLIEEKIIPDSHPYGFKTAAYLPCNFKVKVDAPKVHFAIRYTRHNAAEDVQNEIRVRNFKVTGKK